MRIALPFCLGCLAVAMLPGCDFVDEVVNGPTLPPAESSSPLTLRVPLAAADLPVEHQIGSSDMVMREMTMDEVRASGWILSELMMSAEQIEGRVTNRKIPANAPFYTSDLFLEGAEPGAAPDPNTPDPPWPEPTQIPLLIDELPGGIAYSPDDPSKTFNIPLAASHLPAGRRIRKSDVGFTFATPQRVEELLFPDFEVMIDVSQIKGRRLRKPKVSGEPFLLSDFEVDAAVGVYLKTRQR